MTNNDIIPISKDILILDALPATKGVSNIYTPRGGGPPPTTTGIQLLPMGNLAM
jgi:hypothetical protein